MLESRREWFVKGVRDGIPIMLGYLAVALTLGIAARNAGFTALQATLASLTNNASAGEFAGFTLFQAGAGYLEVAVMTLITNARYLLMSCALSQKIAPEMPLRHRLLLGYGVTDEIFGICVALPGFIHPYYAYGAFCVAIPGWAIGTYLGVALGNVLPLRMASALSVGLYGMFLAIVIPPARQSRTLARLIAVCFAASFLLNRLPALDFIPSGVKTILLTVALSLAAALLFPIREANEHAA